MNHSVIRLRKFNTTRLVITGARRGISKENLCQELGLESLKGGIWLRLMCYF